MRLGPISATDSCYDHASNCHEILRSQSSTGILCSGSKSLGLVDCVDLQKVGLSLLVEETPETLGNSEKEWKA